MADCVIYQTDERMYLLREELNGYSPDKRTHVFAPNVPLNAARIESVAAEEVVVGGRADEEALALFNSQDITYKNILEDEVFQAVNARLTAEGALNVFFNHSLLSLGDSRLLVIGFGRTGAAVARIFKDSGVGELTVATTASKRPAAAFADKVIDAANFNFAAYDVVINTVPKPIISDNETLTFKPTALYIDLASSPALSLCFAKYIGIDADVYPALPAKTSPRSAARAIKDYIVRCL